MARQVAKLPTTQDWGQSRRVPETAASLCPEAVLSNEVTTALFSP